MTPRSDITTTLTQIENLVSEKLAPFVDECSVFYKPEGILRINWNCIHQEHFTWAYRFDIIDDALKATQAVVGRMTNNTDGWIQYQRECLRNQCAACG